MEFLTEPSFQWALAGGIFLLVSVINKDIYPLIGLAFYYGLVYLHEGYLSDGSTIQGVNEMLLVTFAAILFAVGVSYLRLAIGSKYLDPKSEIRIIVYGVLLCSAPAIFLYTHFFSSLEYHYSLSAVLYSGVLLFTWKGNEAFLKKAELAHAQSIEKQKIDIYKAYIEAISIEVDGIDNLRAKLAAAASNKPDMEGGLDNILFDLEYAYANGDYIEAVTEGEKLLQEKGEALQAAVILPAMRAAVELNNFKPPQDMDQYIQLKYTLAKSYDAVGNAEKALPLYQDVLKAYPHCYYAKVRLPHLQNQSNAN